MLSCSMRALQMSCVKRKAALVISALSAYIEDAVCASRQVITSLGPYSILRELSLTRPVGLVTWCPPTSVGTQDRKVPPVAVDRTHSSCSRSFCVHALVALRAALHGGAGLPATRSALAALCADFCVHALVALRAELHGGAGRPATRFAFAALCAEAFASIPWDEDSFRLDLSPCLLNMCVYGPVRSGKPCFPPFVLCHSGTCHDLQNP